MIKKRFIQILAVLLCVAVFCSIPAYGAEVRASSQIDSCSVVFQRKSNGDFSIYFSVQTVGRMDVIGASKVEIQRSTITGWVTEYTFTPSNAPTIQAEGKYQHSAMLTYSPLFTGKEYRAVVMIYVKDASGTSIQQLTSKTA